MSLLRSKKRRSGHRYRFWFLLLALVGLVVWLVPPPDDTTDGPVKRPAPGRAPVEVAPREAGPKRMVTLYSAGNSGGALEKAEVEISASGELDGQIRQALEALFRGGSFTAALYPSDLAVRDVFVYDTIAVVSLGGEFRKKINCGIWTELLAVYGIVNTVAGGFEEIDRAHIIIDDAESDFFVSHISISHPLAPDLSLVKPPANGETQSGKAG